MKYVLGLDIGITSVGWAVLDLNGKRIEALGVRAFNAAEDPKTKAPLAEPRRIARGARRRIRRRAARMRRAKDLFISHGLIQPDCRDRERQEREPGHPAFRTVEGKPNPWQLRAEGLDRLLSGEELARALFHIVKHRGFKSNRKKVSDEDKDSQKMLGSIGGNRALMKEKGYRTPGEMIFKDPKFADHKRNQRDSYENTVDRTMLEDEIRTLFAHQRNLGSTAATAELEAEVLDVFSWQKPYASGDQILKLVGTCTFEEGELRAPRHSYHAERFNLLSKVNSLSYSRNGDSPKLTQEQRRIIVSMAYEKAKVTYAQIRKALNLSEDARFAGLHYVHRDKETKQLVESTKCEDSTFFEMKGYHVLSKACEKTGVWHEVKCNPDLMDDLASALTFYKTDEDIRGYLEGTGAPALAIDAALECEAMTKVLHISTKALKKIIPHLEQGYVFSEACALAGYNHSNPNVREKGDKLPVIGDEITNNPVVRRALSQSRKVVNAVIRKYGSPYRIHIELAREMGKGPEERANIKKRQDESRAESERRKADFVELFKREARGADVLAYRLYREQDGKCAYSLQKIEIDRLFEPGYVQIDHILPYSRSFDDSMSNKVLCLGSENQRKRDRTPFEAFGHDHKRWSEYEAIVPTIFRDPKKRANLLRKEFGERQEEEWKERSLSDTKRIAREFSAFVRDNLKFSDPENKKPVRCVSGRITSRMRGLWGLEKHRKEDDLHHALDAAVIASVTDWQIQAITNHAKAQETRRSVDEATGEIIENVPDKKLRLPLPWPGFRSELLRGLESITVSRMPIRKATGPIHEETIRSAARLDAEGVSTVKKPIVSLTQADLANLATRETDPGLHALILERMEQFDYDAKKAFAEPLHKPFRPKADKPDRKPNLVKSVKVYQTQNTGVPVRKGIADNGRMVRLDVSKQLGKGNKAKYYATPVYVSHFASGELPDVPGEFLFSLYPFDLIRLEASRGTLLGYYRGYNRNTDSLTICEINNAQAQTGSIGIRNLRAFEKFEMGVLGDYHPVRGEVRRGLENRRDRESGEDQDQE